MPQRSSTSLRSDQRELRCLKGVHHKTALLDQERKRESHQAAEAKDQDAKAEAKVGTNPWILWKDYGFFIWMFFSYLDCIYTWIYERLAFFSHV